PPHLRRHDGVGRPVEQHDAELVLQLPHLRAQRGLRDVARLGGEAEVAVPLEGDGVGELEEGHGRAIGGVYRRIRTKDWTHRRRMPKLWSSLRSAAAPRSPSGARRLSLSPFMG